MAWAAQNSRGFVSKKTAEDQVEAEFEAFKAELKVLQQLKVG